MSKVLLGGDNPTSLAMLRDLFETDPEFSLCGQARTGAETISKAVQLKPGLIILDFADWLTEGLQIAEALREEFPTAQVFLLTEGHSFDVEREAVSHGIDAVFSTDEGLGPLLSNARAACRLESLREKNGDGL